MATEVHQLILNVGLKKLSKPRRLSLLMMMMIKYEKAVKCESF